MNADEEKVRRFIDEIREAIRLDWEKLAAGSLTAEKRKEIRQHLDKCQSALKSLKGELAKLNRVAS
jgi:SMC interacting uncharacterized protein involved in chromosome segregation